MACRTSPGRHIRNWLATKRACNTSKKQRARHCCHPAYAMLSKQNRTHRQVLQRLLRVAAGCRQLCPHEVRLCRLAGIRCRQGRQRGIRLAGLALARQQRGLQHGRDGGVGQLLLHGPATRQSSKSYQTCTCHAAQSCPRGWQAAQQCSKTNASHLTASLAMSFLFAIMAAVA